MTVEVIPTPIPGIGAPEIEYTENMNMQIDMLDPGTATEPAVYQYTSWHRIDFVRFKNPDINNLKSIVINEGRYLKSLNTFVAGSPTLESFRFEGRCHVEDYGAAFANCTALTDPGTWDQIDGLNFVSTWEGCSAIVNFPPTHMSNGTNFNATWKNCSSMECMFNLDTSGAGPSDQTFMGCDVLSQPDAGEQVRLEAGGENWVNTEECPSGKLILVLPQQSAQFNLADFINANNPNNYNDVTVLNYLIQPSMIVGKILNYDAKFYNFGELQGSGPVGTPEAVGVDATPFLGGNGLSFYNYGWVRGAGSNGGKGANGSPGRDGSDSLPKVVTWVDPYANYMEEKTGNIKFCPGGTWISVGDGWAFKNGYDISNCDGSYLIEAWVKGPCGEEKLIPGSTTTCCGRKVTLGVAMNKDVPYTIEGGYTSETKTHTIPGAPGGLGGAGGIGGNGGEGEYWNHPWTDGSDGTLGEPGQPGTANTWTDPNGDVHTGNRSGDGEDGADGCTGGRGGDMGQRGWRGECFGDMAEDPAYSIVGYEFFAKGSYIGEVYGSLFGGGI